MKVNKFLNTKKLAILSVLIALVGCAPYLQNLPSNYQFDKSKQRGIAVFSAQCDGPYAYANTAQLMYSDIDNNFWVWESYLPAQIICDGTRQIKAMDLPGGTYHFNGLTYSINKFIPNFPEIVFKVVPGKITYIGSFKLKLGEKNVHFSIGNEEQTDIPLIKNKFTNILSGDYLEDFMKFRD